MGGITRTDPMLHAATPVHGPFIQRLLREGALDGNFEADIAGDSAEAGLFFANLDLALATGFLKTPAADGSMNGQAHVAGYVYAPRAGEPPVGFGLFKDLGPPGFELWLTGIAREARGLGHGRAMLRELIATPPGRLTMLIRCVRESPQCDVATRLFGELGFLPRRTTPSMVWLVSATAAPDLADRIVSLPATA
jgi:ribosomal protein S18 acetylase RimI-like enzyme